MRIDTIMWFIALGIMIARLIQGDTSMIVAILPTLACVTYSFKR